VNSTAPLITHHPEQGCFDTRVEGLRCEVTYQLRGSVMWIVHTGVPRALEGRGIAGLLVAAALAHAREQGLKVVPSCSYVAAYMRRHPNTADLRA